MEKSVLRKDLAPTRQERARAPWFKYNLPEREGQKKKKKYNPPSSLILAQKMPGSHTWFPWERPLLALTFCCMESLPQTSFSMQGWRRRGGITSAFRRGWSCQRGPWKANCAMRENREGGSLLTDTVKRLSKISGRRAKRHFGAFIQMSVSAGLKQSCWRGHWCGVDFECWGMLHSILPFICITSISAADFKSRLSQRFLSSSHS